MRDDQKVNHITPPYTGGDHVEKILQERGTGKFIHFASVVLGASGLACEFYKFPSTTGLDLSNMEDTYHRPDQKTLQALKDMANKLRIDSIESTNTAGSGYVRM